ncbi:ABC transporter permease [Lentzea sp. NPDC059081]|uniref:ABC transporter permease n=1 Tax=Lentzea sp. NPDC059081 TaxID=3346719 RepID=UPI0036BF3F60
MTTARRLLGRLVLALLVVLGAATVAFAAIHLTPGDPVRAILGTSGPSQQLIDQVRAELNLDKPLAVQYGLYLRNLLTGDFGESYQLQQPVVRLIGEQIGASVQLALSSLALALLVSIVLAVATAGRRPALRRVSGVVELLTISTPNFWVAVLLLTVFSFKLHWFPVIAGQGIAGLVLPAVALALGMVGMFTQVLREGMERALGEPFVLSSRARGSSETTVRVRHALRHAIVPLVTLSGWTVGALLSGAVVIEMVFNRPGIGRTLATAIANKDLPVVSGVVVIAAVVFTVVNFLVDVLYRVMDPRVGRFSR